MESLAAYIPEDRRHALSTGSVLPDRSWGAVLFADISGFTPLAESLAQELGPQRGAEELVSQLNRVYGALIAEVQRYRGSVIGFSGDAITCWLDGDDGHRAVAAAFAMQDKMREFATLVTPGGSTASLWIKVAVAVGPVRRFQLGDPQVQVMDVLAGQTLDQVAAAEHMAERGQVIVTREVLRHLAGRVVEAGTREHEATGEQFVLVTGLNEVVPDDPWPPFDLQDQPEAVIGSWLLRPVAERLGKGQSDFLAELRPAVSLFLKFSGIDYDGDDAAGDKLHAYICWVQGVLSRYEGSLIQLTIGDKGSYLYAAFGAPVAHADDPVRAVVAAQTLNALPPHLAYIRDIQIGVAQGRMFAGAYGSETRRTYGVIGDKTNLAARLMGVAQPGQIRCDYDTYEHARARWAFKALPSVRVKGKAGLIRVYEPLAEAAQDRASAPQTLIGRRDELARLAAALNAIVQGQNRVVILEGEAGIGKSRLIAELIQMIREHDISGLIGAGQSIEQQTPYRAWRDVLSAYFGLTEITDPLERQNRIVNLVREIAPDQIARLPLLNDLLNVGLADTDLTASLDPAQRQQSLVALLLRLLRAWTAERPLVLVLEDVHWLDSLSWELTTQVARALIASGEPLLLVLATRALEEHSVGAQAMAAIKELPGTETLSLSSLGPDEILALITARLGLPPDGLPASVGSFVVHRCGGNPFFAEELIFTLRDQGLIEIESVTDDDSGEETHRCIVRGNFAEASQMLPVTLQGLLLARIDRLPPDHKLTLKVAAVIGRTFTYPPLQYILNSYATTIDLSLKEQLGNLMQRDFTLLETREPDLSYIFKHVITQETAYQTLLFSQRRQLHLMAAHWYEKTFRGSVMPGDSSQGIEALAPYYPLLVHHYHFAEDFEHERIYARLAGEQAAAQFANAEAVRYLSRALQLTPVEELPERYAILLNREKVYDLQGQREAQLQDLEALQTLADEMDDPERQGQAIGRFARYAIAIGDYPLTIQSAQEVIQRAQRCGSSSLSATGYFYWGRALWHLGEYASARDQLHQSIALAQAAGARDVEADSLLALGLVAWHQSALDEAKRFFEEALTIFHTISSRGGEAMAYNNLGIISAMTGDFGDASSHFEQCLRISQEMGGRRSEAMAFTNLGNIAAMIRDYARAQWYFEQVVTLSREIGDRQVEASSLGNLGVISDRQGDYTRAGPYFRQALAIYQAIGDRRNEAMVMSNLSLFSHHLGDHAAARDYSRQALAAAETLQDPHLQGEALTYLGHALAALQESAGAADAYRRAVQVRRDLGEQPQAVESLAGLARVALAEGDSAQAQTTIEEILPGLDQSLLDSAEEPLRVHLTCYRVLDRNADPRAEEVLAAACRLLDEQAAQISDSRMRHLFLDNIETHRALLAYREIGQTAASQIQ